MTAVNGLDAAESIVVRRTDPGDNYGAHGMKSVLGVPMLLIVASILAQHTHAQCDVQTLWGASGLGYRVHMDEYVAILTPWTTLVDPQYIMAYRRDENALIDGVALYVPDGYASIEFGEAVAVQGDWLAVGDGLIDNVHMFHFVRGQWRYVQTLEIPPDAGWFGSAIAIDGQLMLLTIE